MGETSLSFSLVTPVTDQYLTAGTDTLEFTYPRVSEPVLTKTILLDQIGGWSSDVLNCGAYQITSCKDIGCNVTTAASDQVGLQSNPTHEGYAPVLQFEYGQGIVWPAYVYLTAQTQSFGSNPIEKTLLVKFDHCNDQPIALATSFNMQVDLFTPISSIDVKDLFSFSVNKIVCNGTEISLSSNDTSDKAYSSPSVSLTGD